MKRLYTASGLPETHLLRDRLDAEGIAVVIFNEHSAGAVGELPCNEALPELWLPDHAQFARARTLLLDYEHAASAPPRDCPKCQEVNPGNFELCWRCGGALTD